MKKTSSDWYLPPEVWLVLVIPTVAILSAMLLPLLARFKSGEVTGIFYAAIIGSVIGVVLLFFARLPLYRQRRFLTFGSSQLDSAHRRLYRVAYVFLGISILLLLLIWLRLRSDA
jgi:hypothetical protein